MSRTPIAHVLVLALALGCGGGGNGEPDAAVGFVEIIPDEASDVAALRQLSDWRALPVFADGTYEMQSSVDRGTGDSFGIVLLENGNRDMNWFVCEGEDAFAFGAGLVPYESDLPACPEEYVEGYVLSRFTGSGVMTRLFMTMFSIESGEPPIYEVLRVYVDDVEEPLIQVRLADVLDGSAGEIFAPPFGKADATHLAWYYPIVFDSKLIVTLNEITGANLVYHQTSVVHSSAGRTASPTRLDARDDAIALLTGARPTDAPELLAPVTVDVPAGEVVRVATLTGPATIHALRVDAATPDVFLRVFWDGEAVPAVDARLPALFGAQLATSTEPSLALDGLELRLPMPFSDSAIIELYNSTADDVAITISADGEPTVPAADYGYLHTHDSETTGPAPTHVVDSHSARGRLVGTCFALEGHAGEGYGAFTDGFNFLEGDEQITVDGTLAVPGTGTEDYLNSSFYFATGPFGTPFAQTWDIAGDDSIGRVSSCRWHVLGDVIDYTTSLEFTLEVGAGDPTLIDRYRSIAFSYREDP